MRGAPPTRSSSSPGARGHPGTRIEKVPLCRHGEGYATGAGACAGPSTHTGVALRSEGAALRCVFSAMATLDSATPRRM